MALSPSEVQRRGKSTLSQSRQKAIEELVDGGLVDAEANEHWPATFATSLFRDRPSINYAIDTYTAKGWNVREVPDSREGNYLEFYKGRKR
jgi:hypothetical protein